jgi:hypothetical protein
MRSARAVYENGHLVFPEGDGPEGRMEVVVVFPDKTETNRHHDRNAGKRFVEKWAGVLKDANIEGWKEQRIEELEKKHQ